jgi:hypothetical protein
MPVYPILPPHLLEEVKTSATALVDTLQRDTGHLAPLLLDVLLRHMVAEINERGLDLNRFPAVPLREQTIEALVGHDLGRLSKLLGVAELTPEAQEWVSVILTDHYPYRAMSDEGLARQAKFKL